MTVHFTSREFNQDLAGAKRAARKAPVFISDRGKDDLVLMSMSEFRRIADKPGSVLARLGSPDTADIDFQADRRQRSSLRAIAFD